MSTTTAPAPAVTSLTYAKKGNARTLWIEGEYPEGNPPQALFDALSAAGWAVDARFDNIPAYLKNWQDGLDSPRVKDFVLNHRGTDLFGGWTETEARSIRRQTNRILAAHGFHRVPVWKKTLADML